MSDASPSGISFLIIGAGFAGLAGAWPGSTFDCQRRTRTFRIDEFVLPADG